MEDVRFAHPTRSRGSRGGYILGALLVLVVAVRAAAQFYGIPSLLPGMSVMGLFAIYYAAEPFLSARLRWHALLYFPIQTVLVILLSDLEPYLDVATILYIVLSMQSLYSFKLPVAIGVTLVYTVLLILTQILGLGWLGGLGLSMLMIAVGAFLISGGMLYSQAQADQEESQAMLARLQEAHRKLKESAARAEELAAARERNRLARELHDTVSQMIFSITLIARSTQVLLERDPSRVPAQLDRLQEMTGAALSQLRSLITQMRPPNN